MSPDSQVFSLRVNALTIMSCLVFLAACESPGCESRTSPPQHGDYRLLGAAMSGDLRLAKRLIEEGADLNQTDSHNRYTPLAISADQGHESVVELLIAKGADLNKCCPLYHAAWQGDARIVKILLEAGAEPNKFRLGRTPSPVLTAAREGHLEVVKLLVAYGSELGTEDGDNSPLLWAAAYGHADVVDYLVTKGNHVDIATSAGVTPLYMAAMKGHSDVVRVLMKHGANPDHKTREGKTPRQIAEEKGYKKVLRIMEAEQNK